MDTIIQLTAAAVGSIGFSAVFGARRKYWFMIAVDAVLSWALVLIFLPITGNFFANLISAAFCSLYAHIAARIVKAPTTCLLMPATVPMIPGGSLYYTLSYAFAGDYEQFRNYAMNTAQVIFAMAIGFAVITLFFRKAEMRRDKAVPVRQEQNRKAAGK